MEQTTAAGSKGGAGGAVGDMQRVWEKAPGFRGWGEERGVFRVGSRRGNVFHHTGGTDVSFDCGSLQ